MSSDEEVDVTNVALSEQVNPGSSSYLPPWNKNCNSKAHKSKKKNLHQTQGKQSHVCFIPSSNDEWVIPETPSPYFIGNKKRQNGDKSEPVATKYKRTCLSNRFLQPDWINFRKKSNHSAHLKGGLKNISLSSCKPSTTTSRSDGGSSSQMLLEQGIRPEKTYDKHSESSIPLSEIDGASSSLGSSSSASNDKSVGFNELHNSLMQYNCSLAFPSTSKFNEDCTEGDHTHDNASPSMGVRFLNSDSDSEESKSCNDTLKGGCHFPGYIRRVKKIIGKRARKVLDTDDSSDNEWEKQQHQPNNCLCSDSDDSDGPILPRKKQFTKHRFSQLLSSDSNEELVNNASGHPRTTTQKDVSRQNSSKNHMCTTFESTYGGEQAEATSNATSSSACSVPSHSGQNKSGSPFLALRNRFSRNKGSSRRSISPHPRILNNQSRTRMSRSTFNQLNHRHELHHLHLVSQFPDLFDAEDSSEVEFFTAHSYSDTETSTESVGAVNVNGSAVRRTCHKNNSTILLGSSDEEISVIFSANNATNSDAVSRRGRNRGPGLRRRRTRGSGRITSHSTSQDIVSVSPDPVAQVRQVEEDERYARILQAEFDAEVNETATYVSTTDSDESAIIDPVGLDSPPPVPFVPPTFVSHSPPIQLRGRPRISNHANTTGGRRRRGRRNVQVHQSDLPWMWQFVRVLGLGPTHRHDHDEPDASDYEALIQLAESVGAAIPRGLRKTEINRLPTRRFYLPGSASTSQVCDEIIHKRTELNKECQVCLCDYENGDILRILPCFHEFHTPCIDPWLKINHTCPVCRVEVAFDE